MTDLWNVWLCGPWVMLIRADRIVALRGTTRKGELATAGDLRDRAGTHDPPSEVYVTVEITGGGSEEQDTHRVLLLVLHPRWVVPAISDLTAALARACESSEAPLYVYYRQVATGGPGKPLWEVASSLPPDWPKW
jgi:hypothetical protein